mmetsp:Transcript_42983/g.62993  ORF Transcript_42983/g.62993 Transcript_42983/m.62993 type:complete len:359 (-) Transcript_42983:463-1539(-)
MGQISTAPGTTAIAFIVWIPRFTSTLSIIGSSTIVYMMISDRKRKLHESNNRFLFCMSLIDILNSLACFVSSAPLPKDSGVYGAIGNDATCTIQGFLIQLGVAVPYYNASLCMFFLLTIRFNMTQKKFALKLEPFFHAVSLLWPLLTAIASVFLGLYHKKGIICWIETGDTFLYEMLFSGVGIGLSFLVVFVCMGWIYLYLWRQAKKMRRYGVVNATKQEAAKQARLFTAAFCLTYAVPAMQQVLFKAESTKVIHLEMTLVQFFFFPLQGLWNFITYARPIVQRIRKRDPNVSFYEALKMMVFHPDIAMPRRGMRRRSTRYGVLPVQTLYAPNNARAAIEIARLDVIREGTRDDPDDS